MNETGIAIKAGNVTIVGIKIETTAAAALETESTGTSSSDGSLNVTAAAANLKMRAAAFNGSLGFYTLGVEVQVLGEFVLQVRLSIRCQLCVTLHPIAVVMMVGP
jgi:hypothetical protein